MEQQQLTTTDIFLTTNTGTWHWSIHYRAGDRRAGNTSVYTYNGEMVIADGVKVRPHSRYRGIRATRMILRNIEGAPKFMGPSMTMTEFKKACKPTGKTLAQVVFGQ